MLTIALILSGLTTLAAVLWLRPKLICAGIVGVDRHKNSPRTVPEMGGLAAVIGFSIGIAEIFTARNFLLAPEILAAIFASLGAALVGMMDDLFHISQCAKALLPFVFSVPLGTVVFYHADTSISLFGMGVDFGVLIILIVPIGVTCASNTVNMLEGFNGLGTGLCIIITTTLVVISVIQNRVIPLVLLLPLLGALTGFYFYNRYPSTIFPGDTLTLFAGATIGSAAIIGGLKTVGAILFIPLIIEFFLKLRGRFRSENFGAVDAQGFLSYRGRTESLTHFLMKKYRLTEPQLVAIFFVMEGILCATVATAVVMFG